MQLAEGSFYFGAYVQKPTIGDALRTVECADIAKANRLLYATAVLGLLVCMLLCGVVWCVVGGTGFAW